MNDAAALDFSRIGFGGASLGNLRREITDAQADGAVSRAWERGIRYFDTAPHYGLGLSERRLGHALRNRERADYVLSSKVGRLLVPRAQPLALDDDGFIVPGDLERRWDFSERGVRESLESSLARLGLDRIDVLFAHDPDQAGPDAARAGLAALAALRDDGLVTAVGIGTNSTSGLEELIADGLIDVLMLANCWSLLDHGATGVMAAAEAHGVTIVAAGVFNSGILALPRPAPGARFGYAEAEPALRNRVERLADVCEAHGVDVPTAAIAFPLLQPAVASVVLGMRSASDVDANVDRSQTAVPAALWADLVSAGLVDAAAVPAH